MSLKRFLSFIPFNLVLLALLVPLMGAGTPKNSAIPPHLSQNHPTPGGRARQIVNHGSFPLAFEPNRGQSDPSVQFLARGAGYTLLIRPQEAVLSLCPPPPKSHTPLLSKIPKGRFHASPTKPATDSPTPTILRLQLEGARSDAAFEAGEKLRGISNYFIGKDPSKWLRGVPQYTGVKARNVYPGVDLLYYGNQGKLE